MIHIKSLLEESKNLKKVDYKLFNIIFKNKDKKLNNSINFKVPKNYIIKKSTILKNKIYKIKKNEKNNILKNNFMKFNSKHFKKEWICVKRKYLQKSIHGISCFKYNSSIKIKNNNIKSYKKFKNNKGYSLSLRKQSFKLKKIIK